MSDRTDRTMVASAREVVEKKTAHVKLLVAIALLFASLDTIAAALNVPADVLATANAGALFFIAYTVAWLFDAVKRLYLLCVKSDAAIIEMLNTRREGAVEA